MRRLVLVNLTQRFAIREDNSVVPITHLFDAFGEETDDDEAAFTIVAGDDRCWFAQPLSELEPLNLN